MPSRRHVLQTCVGVTALAGCSNIGGSPTMLDLTVENSRPETAYLTVRFLRPDVDDRSEAVVYQNDIEVAPGADEWREADAVEQRPYRIEVRVDSERRSHHYHYQPDCSADETSFDIGVLIVLYEDSVSFRQNLCQGG